MTNFIPDDLSSVDLNLFATTQGWQNQYRLITQWGKLIGPKPSIRIEANLIRGCELPVWLKHQRNNLLNEFHFDSDSRVINGLVSLILVVVNGKTSVELKAIDLNQQLLDLGLEKHLTPSRNNGLRSIIAAIEQAILHP